jgi:hypothetical protein
MDGHTRSVVAAFAASYMRSSLVIVEDDEPWCRRRNGGMAAAEESMEGEGGGGEQGGRAGERGGWGGEGSEVRVLGVGLWGWGGVLGGAVGWWEGGFTKVSRGVFVKRHEHQLFASSCGNEV